MMSFPRKAPPHVGNAAAVIGLGPVMERQNDMVYPPGTADETATPVVQPALPDVSALAMIALEKPTKQSVDAYVPVPGRAKPQVEPFEVG